jgi:5'(3')-deoxyribonucleotidase
VSSSERFILGLDLDGTCADFFGRMREIAAEWTATPLNKLTRDVDWRLDGWGIGKKDYARFHRFAVTQRELFTSMHPIAGAPQALRRLGTEGIRIRIITHRLFIPYFHEIAVSQTVRWLDNHGIPYWDLCFMGRKGDIDAHLYVEDSTENIKALVAQQKSVIALSNSANKDFQDERVTRADNWREAERLIRNRYHEWLDSVKLEHPPRGRKPSWDRADGAEDEPAL